MAARKGIKIIHLEYGGEHYYFGSLKVMCQYFGRDKLGMSYNSFRANVRLDPENPFHHKRLNYTVREGNLVRQDMPLRSQRMMELMSNPNTTVLQPPIPPVNEAVPQHETPAKRSKKKSTPENLVQLDLFG